MNDRFVQSQIKTLPLFEYLSQEQLLLVAAGEEERMERPVEVVAVGDPDRLHRADRILRHLLGVEHPTRILRLVAGRAIPAAG